MPLKKERMIKITINGKKYKGVYRWEEMTLGQFCDLAAMPFPEGYEALIIADGSYSPENKEQYIQEYLKATDKQLNVLFPAYYRKVIGILTNIPDSVIINPEKVNELYEFHFKPFILSLIYHAPVIYFMGQIQRYTPPDIKRFRIGLNSFRLPEVIRVMDQLIPLQKEPIITYTEACDLISGNRITKDDVKRLALFMSIYCRKQWESYKEERSLARQDLFMKAPMSAVWVVFFYTVRRLKGSGQITRCFGGLPKQMAESVSEVRTFSGLVHVD